MNSDYLFRNPLQQRTVTSPYGPRKIGDGYHDGEDQRAKVPTKCYPITDNMVVLKSRTVDMDLWGLYVDLYIQEFNITARYAHLSKVYVEEGQTVNMDDPIGLTGNTGFSTGSHLHIGLYYGTPDDMLDKDPDNGAKHKNSFDPAIYFDKIPNDLYGLDVEGYNCMIRAINDGLFELDSSVKPNEPLTRVQSAIIEYRRK